MAEVVWSLGASAQREAIFDYIESKDPNAAAKMDQLFAEAAERLGKFPMIGRPGKITGTREFIPHPNYRLVYETAGDRVFILTLVHVARRWPPVSDD